MFEGDGGILFHIQELETIKRQGLRMLICVMNDGGYGSEFHKLRADGIDDSLAMFGRPPFEAIARGFGLRGHEIRDLSVDPEAVRRFLRAGRKRGLEHPDFRQGHGADHSPDDQARPRQDVSGEPVSPCRCALAQERP